MTSPDTHAQLAASNAERWGRLRDAGFTVEGVQPHFVNLVLERLAYRILGAEGFDEMQMAHEQWLQATLDQAEAAILEQQSNALRRALATPGPIPAKPPGG